MKDETKLLIGCLVLIGAFVLVFGHPRTGVQYTPASTSGTYAPHNPAYGAAVIGAEARAAGHAARFAGRMAFRGGVLRGLGGGHSYTPGGFGFHGFGFGGF